MGRDDEPVASDLTLPYGHPDRTDTPTRVEVHRRFDARPSRRTQELWLCLAQTAMSAEDTEAALARIGEEVDRRARLFASGALADTVQQGMESVWDDIKAGRWTPV